MVKILSERYKNDGKASEKLNEIQLLAKKRVEQKILANYYLFHDVKCPVCDMNDYELIAQKDRYGLPHNTVICKTCGLLITHPAMKDDSLEKFYEEDYRELYTGSKKADLSFFDAQYNHGKQIIDFIEKHSHISINLFLKLGAVLAVYYTLLKKRGLIQLVLILAVIIWNMG